MTTAIGRALKPRQLEEIRRSRSDELCHGEALRFEPEPVACRCGESLLGIGPGEGAILGHHTTEAPGHHVCAAPE